MLMFWNPRGPCYQTESCRTEHSPAEPAHRSPIPGTWRKWVYGKLYDGFKSPLAKRKLIINMETFRSPCFLRGWEIRRRLEKSRTTCWKSSPLRVVTVELPLVFCDGKRPSIRQSRTWKTSYVQLMNKTLWGAHLVPAVEHSDGCQH